MDQFFDKYNEMDADGTGTMRVSVAWVDSESPLRKSLRHCKALARPGVADSYLRMLLRS